MRKAIAVGLVVVLALVVVAWKACGSSSSSKTSAAHGTNGTHGSSFVSSRLNRTGPVEPASIAGRVTRAQDGAPVAGATVSLAPAELMAMFIKSDMPTLVATTDASGNWKADRVMPGAYVVAATASGYLPAQHDKITVQQGEARTGIDIALTQGGTIVSGTVSDVGGGPIADARITANKGSEIPDLSGHAEYVVSTKPDGTYEITLPDGEFRLGASHDDYTSAGHRIEVAGKPLTQDFQLIPGAVIRGTVVAKDTGKPVPGALVRAEGGERGGRGGGDDGGTTIADADGNFTIRSLGSGTLELKALGRGYASPQTGTVVSVGIGEQVDGVRVLVERAYSISGRVVKKGKPDEGVPGITLGAFSIAAKAFGLAIEPSGPDGSFEIYGVQPASYMLFAVGEGTVPEIGKNVEVVDKDVTDVIVEMSAGVTVSGVVSPPMPGALITVEMEGEFSMARMFDMAKLVLIRGETDQAGAFTLKNVPPGAFKLNAGAPDGHTGETPVVIGEQDKAGVVIKLEPRASVSGRVTDSNGKPVAGGKVYVDSLDPDDKKMRFSFNDMRNRNSATTAPDGTYKVVGLEAGKVRVRASDGIGDDFFFMAKKDQPAKSAVEITLAAAQNTPNVNLQVEARDGSIRGTVLMPDGKPAKDAWVTAHRARDKDPSDKESRFEGWLGPGQPPVLTDDAGAFTINKLRKGSYNLMVDGPKGTSHAEQNGVKTGESVTIKLLALGTLTGTVTLAGAPVPSYDIECRGPHFDNSDKHVDSKDGAYELERLTPGAYTCSVDSPTASGSGKIDVPAGEAKLDIALTRFASVTGTVVSVLDKKPIAGVNVFAGNDANMNSATFTQMLQGTAPKTDAAGKFKVDRVPTGKGKVAVMPKDGFMPLGTRDYTVVSEGQVVDVGVIEVVPPREGDAGTFGMSTGPTPPTPPTPGAGSGSATELGDKLVVLSVKEGGPAQLAGVKEGDLIAKINGQDVGKLGAMTASNLLASGTVGVGVTVTLSIERAGQPIQATLTSVKW